MLVRLTVFTKSMEKLTDTLNGGKAERLDSLHVFVMICQHDKLLLLPHL